MINTSLDLAPPIRGLESFSFSMFYSSEVWMMVFIFTGCEHILFLVWKKRNYHDIFVRSYIDF